MFDPFVIASGLFVGFVVGLTGMGGGALMTPILVLFFHIEPLAAVSSDIVAAMIMKPVGGAVHWRRGTVNRRLVAWLMAGSIPSAFLGVLFLKRVAAGAALQSHIKTALGIALLAVIAGLIIRPILNRRHHHQAGAVVVRPLPTLLIGILGGVVVGLTSVGSGSLIIVMLLMLYPTLPMSEMVGTDLVQAVPLVASAAVGHILFGDFKLGLTASILIGSLPGVFIGARFSSRAPDYVIRPSLCVVLLMSGLKLIGVSNLVVALVMPVAIGLGVAHVLRAARRARETARRAAVPGNGAAADLIPFPGLAPVPEPLPIEQSGG